MRILIPTLSANLLLVCLFAATSPRADSAQPAPPAASPVTGVTLSEPASASASNIDSADTKTDIAPSLPSLDLGPGATASDYLRAARVALATGRTGEAQQAMEMAETRLLDRSTPLFQTDVPSSSPAVAKIGEALRALGGGDLSTSMQLLDEAIPLAAQPDPPSR